jgi:hypothetical protein
MVMEGIFMRFRVPVSADSERLRGR